MICGEPRYLSVLYNIIHMIAMLLLIFCELFRCMISYLFYIIVILVLEDSGLKEHKLLITVNMHEFCWTQLFTVRSYILLFVNTSSCRWETYRQLSFGWIRTLTRNHESRDSISLISYAGLISSNFGSFTLNVRCGLKSRKICFPCFWISRSFRSSMFVPPEWSSAVLVMIRSKSVSICNR